MNKISGVYKITCIANNKIYIGSSFNILKRISIHFRDLKNNKHINKHMNSSYNLYGEDSFKWEIIEECNIDSLLDREQFWMDKTECYKRDIGFNNTTKADRPTGYQHTEESKLKMSQSKKGKSMHENTRIALNKSRGPHSEKTKQKISESKIGDKNPRFGFKESEDSKSKRMKNMLSKPRWNKGLTKDTDPRILKLRSRVGCLPHNAKACKLENLNTGEIWVARTIKQLSNICPISLSSINRLISGSCGEELKKIYIFSYES